MTKFLKFNAFKYGNKERVKVKESGADFLIFLGKDNFFLPSK